MLELTVAVLWSVTNCSPSREMERLLKGRGMEVVQQHQLKDTSVGELWYREKDQTVILVQRFPSGLSCSIMTGAGVYMGKVT
jgi:hypothetical protein